LFEDLTHPIRKDFDHKTWNEFASDLTDACSSFFPPKAKQYSQVHGLLLNWKDDDLGTQTELVDLDSLLRDQFNFTTELWEIPSKDSENALEKKLSEVKGELDAEGKLLIVYYGGHGVWNKQNRSIWAA
jgi:hypothetical protein